jgi:hypothetical protein
VRWLNCPYLGSSVELTGEREAHIAEQHPEILPGRLDLLDQTLFDPDYVCSRPNRRELGFIRYMPSFLGGRYVVAVVVSDVARDGDRLRFWLVTAYVARRPSMWSIQWQRS